MLAILGDTDGDEVYFDVDLYERFQMKLTPTHIEVDGPGVDLSNRSSGLSVKMADPQEGFAYVHNTVTLTYDLTDYTQVRLSFEAKEFGDEPHAPPSNPFTGEVNFDGVAISSDGVAWFEIQDLRHLRSDRFTTFDIDLDAAVDQWVLSYNNAFQVRFCQYDNNPGPMDGIFLHRIELTGEQSVVGAPVFHLPMDDCADNPTVRDLAAGGLDQVFIDSSGDPNTAAHSVSGPNGTTALSFDGIDDRIDFGTELLGDIVAAGNDFTIAMWYRTDSDPGPNPKIFFCRSSSSFADPHIRAYIYSDCLYWRAGWGDNQSVALSFGPDLCNGLWHHFALRRQSQTLSLWIDGVVRDTRTDPDYAQSFYSPSWRSAAIGQIFQNTLSDGPFEMADFRAYDRALSDEEIQRLSQREG